MCPQAPVEDTLKNTYRNEHRLGNKQKNLGYPPAQFPGLEISTGCARGKLSREKISATM